MNDAVKTFLKKPLIAYLVTIDLEGYPHNVPVWFEVDGEDIISSVVENRSRVKYIRANPKSTITIGGNTGDEAGYMFVGDMEINADDDLRLMRQIFLRYTGEDNLKNYETEGRIILRLKVKKVIQVR